MASQSESELHGVGLGWLIDLHFWASGPFGSQVVPVGQQNVSQSMGASGGHLGSSFGGVWFEVLLLFSLISLFWLLYVQ